MRAVKELLLLCASSSLPPPTPVPPTALPPGPTSPQARGSASNDHHSVPEIGLHAHPLQQLEEAKDSHTAKQQGQDGRRCNEVHDLHLEQTLPKGTQTKCICDITSKLKGLASSCPTRLIKGPDLSHGDFSSEPSNYLAEALGLVEYAFSPSD